MVPFRCITHRLTILEIMLSSTQWNERIESVLKKVVKRKKKLVKLKKRRQKNIYERIYGGFVLSFHISLTGCNNGTIK